LAVLSLLEIARVLGRNTVIMQSTYCIPIALLRINETNI